MIAFVIVVITVAGLIFLARLEGRIPADHTEHNSVEVDLPGTSTHSHSSAQHEVLRFAASMLAIMAGAAAAAGLASVSAPPLLIAGTAAVLCILITMLLLRAGDRSARESQHHGASRKPPLRAMVQVSSLVRSVGRVGSKLASFMRPRSPDHDNDASEQFSKVLSAEASMSADEEKLVRGAISLPRTTVRDIMVPRGGVVGIETGTPWSEVLDRVRSSEHSRLPAFRSSLDDVTGVLVAKDLLPYALAESAPSGGWEKLARPAAFVPATKPVADQLREFRNSRTHMAIVVDEYGGTAGILTIEDVLEELVGEIRDEHDVEEPLVRSEDGIRFWVAGRLTIDELEEILDEKLGGGMATTVGGLIFERMGRIPKVGEELKIGNLRIVVERLKRHAPDRVYIEHLGRVGESR